jgi:UDP:flavonoid glycosyltransferase YjiC (YdhE family)
MAYDQFDTARRVARLGVGGHLGREEFTPSAVAEALRRLVASPDVAASCERWAQRLRGTDPVAAACAEIEELLPQARDQRKTLDSRFA